MGMNWFTAAAAGAAMVFAAAAALLARHAVRRRGKAFTVAPGSASFSDKGVDETLSVSPAGSFVGGARVSEREANGVGGGGGGGGGGSGGDRAPEDESAALLGAWDDGAPPEVSAQYVPRFPNHFEREAEEMEQRHFAQLLIDQHEFIVSRQ